MRELIFHASTMAIFLLLLTSSAQAGSWLSTGNSLCRMAGNQTDPIAVSDGENGAFVGWVDERNNATKGQDIYINRILACGSTSTWDTAGIAVCAADSNQNGLAMVSDGQGGVIAAWADKRNGNFDIYAQRVNSSGVPQWTANGVAVCTASGFQAYPQIVSDGSSGAIIVWYDARAGTQTDIAVQHLNSSGTALWTSNGALIGDPNYPNGPPSACSDDSGGVFLTWERDSTGKDILARRVAVNGTIYPGLWICIAPNDQTQPVITMDINSCVFIAWSDKRNGLSNSDIYAQRRTRTGGLPSGWQVQNGRVVCTATNHQFNPVITRSTAGGAIVAWIDERGTSRDVYAQRMLAGGDSTFGTNGKAICDTAAAQEIEAILSTPAANDNGAIFAWIDFRNGNEDIFAHHIRSDGVLPSGWRTYGEPVATGSQSQLSSSMASDGRGGALLTAA